MFGFEDLVVYKVWILDIWLWVVKIDEVILVEWLVGGKRVKEIIYEREYLKILKFCYF